MYSKTIKIKCDKNTKLDMNYFIKYNTNMNENIINKEKNKEINEHKILLFHNKIWNDFRKICNNYELVNIILNNKNEGISLKRPLSRSYYKMIEIIQDYKIIEYLNNEFNSINNISLLAEAPGGFLESLNDTLGDKVNYYAISLIKNDNNNVPNWNYAMKKYNKKNNINFLLGKDNTGNIYNLCNIFNFINIIGRNSCELITADGGLDFSNDYLNQEQLFYRLFLCEITLALSLQKVGGVFICKIFDFNTIISIKLIYLLNLVYDEVLITKPTISRDANSEKYLVCKNFKEKLNFRLLKILYKTILNWEYNNLNVVDIFDINIPKSFISSLEYYGLLLYKRQEKSFKYIKNLYLNLTKKKLYNILNNQIKTSFNWCKKYNIDIEHNSIFLKYNLNTIIKNHYHDLLLFKFNKLK